MKRREFIQSLAALPALAASAPFAASVLAAKAKRVPVGLELYSVREELSKDLMGTVRAVAKMGYEVVEFYSPYYSWTTEYAKEVRKLLDDLNIKCLSTHNGANALRPEGIQKAIELNQILGSKTIVMASPGRVSTLDDYKKVAETLSAAAEKLKPLGLRAGYHNHKPEFALLEGKRPMEIIAAGTPKDVVLQLDVGTCLEAGADPVAWIKAHPGRIRSMHCKDWSAKDGYHVLVGEGAAPWAAIRKAAESVGGIEYYLIEQEGSRLSPIETAERCLANWKSMKV